MSSPFDPFQRPPSYVHGPYPHSPYPHTPHAEPDVPTDVERLRGERRSRVFPVAAAVVGLYLLNALLANLAGGLMAARLVGHLNIGLALALLQCAGTLLVCRWYARHAGTTLDPLAARVRAGLGPRGSRR
ncbi:DUF485 domain-containing protein [Streptomyces sp. NPDC049597]|uniref:DUF485 domain-containing protein n=1 Tax=Streptomyces sp. NPDC049597 TaxID=3155276 RepID=UPI003430DADB